MLFLDICNIYFCFNSTIGDILYNVVFSRITKLVIPSSQVQNINISGKISVQKI